MSVRVSYNKRKDKMIVETDDSSGDVTHRRLLNDPQIRTLLKYHNIGPTEARDEFNLKRKLNEKYRAKTGSDYIFY